MIKKPSFWAGVIGVIIIIGSATQIAGNIYNPTDLPMVNTAIVVGNLLWAFFGIFLIVLFLRNRNSNDINNLVKLEPNSQEDIIRLDRQRKWILSFVILIEILGSIEAWVLNDYLAGFTIINITVILDLFINIILFFVVIALFKEKKSSLNILFYLILIYTTVLVITSSLRSHWYAVSMSIFMAIYFVFAIKMPLNRKNYRITHLALLPIFLIFLSLSSYFDNGNLFPLSKSLELHEQQFFNENDKLNGAYILFFQKEIPSKVEIQAVKNAVDRRESIIKQLVDDLHDIRQEYKDELPSVSQEKILEKNKYILEMLDVNRKQAEKVLELMNYAENIDFENLTEEQEFILHSLKEEVESFNNQITDVQFKLNNPNLN